MNKLLNKKFDFLNKLLGRPNEIQLIKDHAKQNIIDIKEIVYFGKINKVSSIVTDSFKRAGILSDEIEKIYNDNKTKMDGLHAEIEQLLDAINKFCIDIVVLENCALLLLISKEPVLFEFGDIDILVKEDDFERLIDQLSVSGYERCKLSSGFRPSAGERVVMKSVAGRLKINIQSTIIAHEFYQPEKYKNNESLFDLRRVIRPPHVGALGNEDFLMQLCLHTKSHSLVRKPGIRLHLDMDWYVRSTSINWTLFLSLVKQYDFNKCCFFALATPVHFFNTPVPENVLKELKPGKIMVLLWKKMILNKLPYKKISGLKFSTLLSMLIMEENCFHIFKIICPEKKWLKEKYGKSFPLFKHLLTICGLRRSKLH